MARRRRKEAGRGERNSAESLVLHLTRDLLRLAGLDLGVRVVPEKGPLNFRVYLWGPDLELLQCSEGLPWEALGFLLKQMASRSLERSVNITLEATEDDPRKIELHQLALRMAEKVMRTGQPVELEPMPAWERREIHITLQDHPHVFTQSVGKEPRRRVRILPRQAKNTGSNEDMEKRPRRRRRRKR